MNYQQLKTKSALAAKTWIALNLISIKGFADEIVIVGAPTDETPEIIEKVELMHRRNGMMIHKEFLMF